MSSPCSNVWAFHHLNNPKSTRKEHPIKFAQNILQLGLRIMVEQRYNLRTGHLQILHIRGSNIGRVFVDSCEAGEIFGVLRVDADHWLLGGLSVDGGEGEDQGESGQPDGRLESHY